MSISVVIPTLNEENTIGKLLDRLEVLRVAEVIVVDGGSTDETVNIVHAHQQQTRKSIRLEYSGGGRGAQQAMGASAATSEILWFLHADSLPARGCSQLIAEAMDEQTVSMGTLRLSFDHKHQLLRLYSVLSVLDTPFTTFGDQGFFMRRTDYDLVGGVPDWPLFEDVCLRQKLRKLGHVRKINARIVTSARRFAMNGILRQQLRNSWLVVLYFMGVAPEKLARLYKGKSKQSAQSMHISQPSRQFHFTD